MVAEVYVYFAASASSAFSNFFSWHFVWRHEGPGEENRTLNESIFWILFSYILPFLPSIFYLLAEGDYLGPMMSTWSTGILCAMLSVLMLGQAMSSWSWKQKSTPSSLSEQAKLHFSWTTVLTAISGILWLAILFMYLP